MCCLSTLLRWKAPRAKFWRIFANIGEKCGEKLAKFSPIFVLQLPRKVGAKNFTKNPRLIPQAMKQNFFTARLWELGGTTLSQHSTSSASVTTLDFQSLASLLSRRICARTSSWTKWLSRSARTCSSWASRCANCARRCENWSLVDGIIARCATLCANCSCWTLPIVALWATVWRHPSCAWIRLLIQLDIWSWTPRMAGTRTRDDASWNRAGHRMLDKSVFLARPLENHLTFWLTSMTAHNLCWPLRGVDW